MHRRTARSGSTSEPRRFVAESSGPQVTASASEDYPDDDMLTEYASSTHVLLPSYLAFNVVRIVPLCIWLASTCVGTSHFLALPEKKSEVMHLMSSFDRTLFRTVGPLLPLAVLALRWLALDLPTVFVRAAGGDPKGVQDRPSTDTTTTLGPVYARATMISSCLLVYCIVALCRIALYSLHLALQHSSASGDLNHVAAAWMSDHLVLGASVVACLQVEIVCALSDVVKSQAVTGSHVLHGIGAASALMLALALYSLTCLDMYFTASLFHPSNESSVSIILGAFLFQAPVAVWLRKKFNDGPWAQAHRVACHVQ